MFSGTGHGDGAVRNNPAIRNSQQSCHTTTLISLNSMFTFATGFHSTKIFSIFGPHRKTNWQTPRFHLHAQLPSSSAFLFVGSPSQEGCPHFPIQLLCSQSCVCVSVVGELHLTGHEEQTLQAQVHDGPRQVTSQLLSFPKTHSILPLFFRHCSGVLAQIRPKVRTCDVTYL